MSQLSRCFLPYTNEWPNSFAAVSSFTLLFTICWASFSPNLINAANTFLVPPIQDGSQTDHQLQETKIFVSGTGGYDTYRIPSLIVAQNGDLLAFCEARRLSRSDTGDIDLLLRRSVDGGKTWSAPSTVWDDDKNTCGNPCQTGRLVACTKKTATKTSLSRVFHCRGLQASSMRRPAHLIV